MGFLNELEIEVFPHPENSKGLHGKNKYVNFDEFIKCLRGEDYNRTGNSFSY